jgi:hypothetical protein
MKRSGYVWIVILLLLQGCAPLRVISDQNIDQIIDEFSGGKTTLRDSPLTIKNYVDNRAAMHLLYSAEDWKSLAKLVIQVDYDNDLMWFYLARSAEGLGFKDAAKKYYLNSASTIHKCNNTITGNECNGLVFPRDITYRFRMLSKST